MGRKSHTWAPLSQVWGHCILMLRASLGKVVHTVKRAGTYAAKVPPQELHKIAVHVRAVSTMFSGVTDSLYTVHNPVHSVVLLSFVGIVIVFTVIFSILPTDRIWKNPLRWLSGDKKNAGKWLWLDKVILETLKLLKMVLCSSREWETPGCPSCPRLRDEGFCGTRSLIVLKWFCHFCGKVKRWMSLSNPEEKDEGKQKLITERRKKILAEITAAGKHKHNLKVG